MRLLIIDDLGCHNSTLYAFIQTYAARHWVGKRDEKDRSITYIELACRADCIWPAKLLVVETTFASDDWRLVGPRNVTRSLQSCNGEQLRQPETLSIAHVLTHSSNIIAKTTGPSTCRNSAHEGKDVHEDFFA
jgi:hypothetical protein